MGVVPKLVPYRVFGVDQWGVFVEVGADTLAGAVVMQDMYSHTEYKSKIWSVFEQRFITDSEVGRLRHLLIKGVPNDKEKDN